MNRRYKDAVWRLPTKDEATAFIHAAEVEPTYDLKGSGWTSTLYPGSDVNGWSMDYKRRPDFSRFDGTTRMDHGFRHACIRLVTEVCDIHPGQAPRLENDGECWVDHMTGLAWRIHFIDEDGNESDSGGTIWVGPLQDAYPIIDRFNQKYHAGTAGRMEDHAYSARASVDAQSIVEKWGRPTLVLKPGEEIDAEQKLLEGIADEYWLFLNAKAEGGCLIYGRFQHRWVANPSSRWPMAELLRMRVKSGD